MAPRLNGPGKKWLQGVIKNHAGPVSFLVKIQDGRERCHQDQFRTRAAQEENVSENTTINPESVAAAARTTDFLRLYQPCLIMRLEKVHVPLHHKS